MRFAREALANGADDYLNLTKEGQQFVGEIVKFIVGEAEDA